VSKRSNDDPEEGELGPGKEARTNQVVRFFGNTHFQVAEWVDWREDLFAIPIRSFLKWKRIDRPEDYFRETLPLALNPKTDTYFRGAYCHGLEAQDFAKVVITVAHFVERAASGYPDNKLHRLRCTESKPDTQTRTFRLVPFGEIFAVLGANAKDPELEFLLQGTAVGWKGERLRLETLKALPDSDFKAHSKFLFLALSLLLEYGVLEVFYQTYPTTLETTRIDNLIPYDKRVRSFQEFIFRCDTDLADYTFCFAPQELYSNVAWRVLVSTLTQALAGRCLGQNWFDHKVFNCAPLTEHIERHFDYDNQPYWCPVIYRDHPIA